MLTFFRLLVLTVLLIPVFWGTMLVFVASDKTSTERYGAAAGVAQALAARSDNLTLTRVTAMAPAAKAGEWTLTGIAGLAGDGDDRDGDREDGRSDNRAELPFTVALRSTCLPHHDRDCWSTGPLQWTSTASEAAAAGAASGPAFAPLSETRRILQAQAQLKALGFDPGPVDGVLGARTKRALDAYAQDQVIDGDSVSRAQLIDRLTMIDRVDSARLLYEKGDFHGAMGLLSKVLRAEPDNAGAHLYRGMIYRGVGLPENAIASYETVIALDPDLSFAYYDRGNARFQTGHYGAALSDYAASAGFRALVDDAQTWGRQLTEWGERAVAWAEPWVDRAKPWTDKAAAVLSQALGNGDESAAFMRPVDCGPPAQAAAECMSPQTGSAI